MTTIEEKQAELDALQTAFDEYIASSRELEEELDAELTKCQNDLSSAESRNAALVSQLANVTPQLTSLESKIATITTQLKSETQLRIAAENASEEAENKLRKSEGALAALRSNEGQKWKEECEQVYERLAFVEDEAEEYRRELESEMERHRVEMEEVKGDLYVLREMLAKKDAALMDVGNLQDETLCTDSIQYNGCTKVSSESFNDTECKTHQPEEEFVTTTGREEYITTLEDELELVTEQLIGAESKLSQTQADLEEALKQLEFTKHSLDNKSDQAREPTDFPTKQQSERIAELEAMIVSHQEENISLHKKLQQLEDEIELTTEELLLTKEELKAVEDDGRARSTEFEIERKQLKDQITALQIQLEKGASDERSRAIQSKSWEEALLTSEKQTELLHEHVARLELALANSKTDCESLQLDLSDLKSAFDDSVNRCKHEITEELLATKSREVEELNEQVKNLNETNSLLTNALNETESNLKKWQAENELEKNEQSHTAPFSEHLRDNDRVQSLEYELKLSEKRVEVDKIRNSLQEKIIHTEEKLQTAEMELESARSKLLDSAEGMIEESPRSYTDKYSSRVERISQLLFAPKPLMAAQMSELVQSHISLKQPIAYQFGTRPRSCSPTNIERREVERVILIDKVDRLNDQNRMSAGMKSHLESQISQLQKELISLKSGKIQRQPEEREPSFDAMIMNLEDRDVDEILKCNNPTRIAEELRVMSKKLFSQKSHNAELLTRILKLQGNIQVCCRIRPMSMDESQRGFREVAQALSETELGCFDERTKTWKSYAFDKVWGPESRQRDVFQDVEPMILSVIDGYNACIFAYGQTGSGKTFTMEGDKDSKQFGISQRTIYKIFQMLEDRGRQHENSIPSQCDDSNPAKFEYSIEIGMLEIYNDEVYDLLVPNVSKNINGSLHKKALNIRHSSENTIEVPDLTKERVTSVAEVLNALDRGNSNRSTGSTNLNERSSRSHMILQVEVSSGVGEAKQKASLYLVDLAGSERVRKSEVEGKALKEAQHINKSLSSLGNVMEALDQKSSHVPYRDSKLTFLLQNSLGGNSRTMMVVTICPHNDSYDETAFALKFATRVRRINLGTANKNVTAKNLEETIKNLNSQMNLLSKAKERSEGQLLSLKREKERIEDKLAKVSASRTNSKNEMRTLSALRQSNNDITSRWQKEKLLREEKTTELEQSQEELRRVHAELTSLKRDHESLAKQIEDKENLVFELKRDLRCMKEKLNEEKIRHRKVEVMQSRIPAPMTAPTRGREQTQKVISQTLSIRSTSSSSRSLKSSDKLAADILPYSSNPNVARIRARILKILQEHDPTKVVKIDAVMKQFEGRETELLEKMMARYESTVNSDSMSSTPPADSVSMISSMEEKPISRQQKALERHMARINRKKTLTEQDK